MCFTSYIVHSMSSIDVRFQNRNYFDVLFLRNCYFLQVSVYMFLKHMHSCSFIVVVLKKSLTVL